MAVATESIGAGRRFQAPVALVAVLGVLAGVVAAAIIAASDHRDALGAAATLTLVEGWGHVAAGVVARLRQPSSRVGSLMIAIGFAWLWTAVQFSDDDVIYRVSTATAGVFFPLFLWVLVGFPGGRADTRAARLVLAAAWTAFGLFAVLFLTTSDLRAGECASCLSDVFPVASDLSSWSVLAVVSNAVSCLLGIAAMGIMAVRYRAASAPGRRVLLPVMAAGGVVIAILVLHQGSRLVSPSPGGSEALLTAAYVCFALAPLAFLLGLLRHRLLRSALLAELVHGLQHAVAVQDVRAVLARTLSDDRLALAFRTPGGAVVDGRGEPFALPGAAAGLAVTEVTRGEAAIAAIVHDDGLLADPDLMPSVAATAAIALERARLEVDLRAGLEQLQASRARIVEAGDAARRRIERDLHDGAQQRLVSLALLLARMEGRLAADDLAATRELVGVARQELIEALRELRELARGIHPAVLTDHGLVAALRALAERIDLPVTVTAEVTERFPPAVEAVLYFVAAEALTNVQKHAGASSAAVTVARTAAEVELVVADDGRGGAAVGGGTGLRGLADRVEALRGTLAVHSPAGGGTEVLVRVPCAEAPTGPGRVTPAGSAARRAPVDGPRPWAAA